MATENSKKTSMLNGALILMLAILMVKVIGVLFKMPMTSMIGTVGRGYFNSAYEIYTPIFAVSMAGLPVAVARMVAESVALEKYRQARAVFMTSKKVFFIVGVAGTILLLIVAYPYARYIANLRSLKAILCVAPSIFLCCYMSAYRGYYEGLRNMVPTAISQVIEALGKLVIGLSLIKLIMSYGYSAYESGIAATANEKVPYAVVFGTKVTTQAEANGAIVPWAAAGAVLGVTIGSALSLLFLILCFRKKGDSFNALAVQQSPAPDEGSAIAKQMIKIAIPMVISALILNLTNLIDTMTIQARLATAIANGRDTVIAMHQSITEASNLGRLNLSDSAEIVKYLWGAYGTALDFKTLVPTITVQLGVSAIPALATAWALKNSGDIRKNIETVLRIGMLIALPAGFGMAALAEPILQIIYGRGNSSEAIALITPILISYGIFTPIIAISIPTTNMLQAVGRAEIPMYTVAGAAVVKIICNFTLVGMPKINIYGAVFGTIIFYVLIVAINMTCLLKISKVKVNFVGVFLKPCIAAALCAVTAYAAHGIITRVSFFEAHMSAQMLNAVAALVAVCLGALVYFITILLIKGIAKDDVMVLPKGEKIAKVLEKYGLLG